MGFPAAVTEEAWNLGTELALIHALIFSLVATKRTILVAFPASFAGANATD